MSVKDTFSLQLGKTTFMIYISFFSFCDFSLKEAITTKTAQFEQVLQNM